MAAECIECGEEYSSGRQALGYNTCLECGDNNARTIYEARTRANLRAMTPNASAGSVRDVFRESDDERRASKRKQFRG